MRFNEISNEQQTIARLEIVRADEDLKSRYFSCVERAVKTLFLLNGGGLIAILAYLYRGSLDCAKVFLMISLVSFLLEIMTAAILVAIDFFSMLSVCRDFQSQAGQFYKNNLIMEEIDFFNPRFGSTITAKLPIGVGCISFLFAGSGILSGLIGFFIS